MNSKQKTVLALVIVTNLVTSFLSSSMNLSSPNIGDEFGVGATTLTWVVSAFTLTIAMFALPTGGLADTIGRRRMFVGGVVLFLATTILGAIAPSIWVLIASRVGQAIGGAMIQSSNVPIALSMFPPQRRGWVLGWTVSAVYVGLGLGPVLGGVINQYLGWRPIFAFAAIGALAVLVLAWKHVPVDDIGKVRLIDIPGNVLLMASIFCLIFGMSNLNSFDHAWVIIVLGAILMGGFIYRENHTDEPVIDLKMFTRDRVFTFSSLAALMNYSATFAISYTMALYLQTVLGLPSATAGLIMVCQPIVQAVVSPICGKLSDRIAPSLLASLGMACSSIGLLLLSFVQVDSTVTAVIVPLVVVGLGFGLFSSPNNNAALSHVRPQEFGRANSTIGTMRSLGMSLSLAILTLVFAVNLGDTLVTAADPVVLTTAIQLALRINAGICGVGVVFSAIRGK